jgi:GGDEF domain-containing protein
VVVSAAFFAWMTYAVGKAADGHAAWVVTAFTLVQVLRLAVMVQCHAGKGPGWPSAYFALNALTGAIWGACGAYVYASPDAGAAALAAVGLGGMCGTAVPMYGGDRKALWTFTTPMMVPLIATQFLSSHPYSAAMAGTMLIGWLSTLATGRQVERSVRAVVDGRARYALLVEELQAKNNAILALNRRLTQAAQEREIILEHANVGIALVDKRSLSQVNTYLSKAMGRSRSELIDSDVTCLADADHTSAVESLLEARARLGEARADVRVAGEPSRWFDVAVTGVPDSTVSVWALSNVTGRIENHRRVEQLAEQDALTGLTNRRGLDRHVAEWQSERKCVAFVVIDLDGFKPINDRHGHAVGDAVLREVGSRLRTLVRPTDLAARTGGDEFAILVTINGSADWLEAFCQRLVDGAVPSIRYGRRRRPPRCQRRRIAVEGRRSQHRCASRHRGRSHVLCETAAPRSSGDRIGVTRPRAEPLTRA